MPRAATEPMAFVITQKCVGVCDTGCVDVCPVDCIVGPVPLDELRAVPAAQRGAKLPGLQMYIDPDECIDCGCCEAACPAAAIFRDDDVPEEHRHDIARNAAFFRRTR